jgi:SPP1 family predicted phage head-tail adaptor
MDIKIAELRHRIALERLQQTPDGQGGATLEWNLVQECWAKITPKSGAQRVFAQKLEDVYDHEIIIRNTLDHLPQKAADRIRYDDRLFHIHSVQYVDEREWWILIRAREGVAS